MSSTRPESKEDKEVTTDLKLRLPFLEDIQAGVYPLQHVAVYYVNRSLPGQYGAKLHGFPIIKSSLSSIKVPNSCLPDKPYKLKQQYSDIFYLGDSYKYSPYHVSNALLTELHKEKKISKSTKQIMQSMADKTYPTTEYFVRDFLIRNHPTKSTEEIYAMAANSNYYDSEIDTLIDINIDIHGICATIIPYNSSGSFCRKDVSAFDKNDGCEPQEYPDIDATAVYELFSQCRHFINYIEEKLGVGHAVGFQEKLTSVPDAERIMKRLVKFVDVPKHPFSDNSYFLANCNTATATLLQEAKYISLVKESKTVTGASFVSVGSSHRMFFHGSRLQRLIIDAFINREYKKDDPVIKKMLKKFDDHPDLLQELSDNKDSILSVIATWPAAQHKKALEQILDPDSPFGKIFLTKRTNYLRTPDHDRGTLKKAADALEEINKILSLESEFEFVDGLRCTD